MTDDADDPAQLIEDCEARESRLGDWDRSFIDSIKRQLEQGGTLSPKQADKLGEIWERVTAQG